MDRQLTAAERDLLAGRTDDQAVALLLRRYMRGGSRWSWGSDTISWPPVVWRTRREAVTSCRDYLAVLRALLEQERVEGRGGSGGRLLSATQSCPADAPTGNHDSATPRFAPVPVHPGIDCRPPTHWSARGKRQRRRPRERES